MKPLAEMNLNKCAIVGAAHSEKEKGRARRPALELLNILNSKLVEENHVAQFRKEMESLKEENQHLKVANDELSKELEVEKRLRKVWNREEAVLYEDV
jgi:regulator of replication initiation timing